MSTPRLFALLFLLFPVVDLRAAAPPGHPLPSRIAAWIGELGDEDFEVRKQAAARLRAAGEAAESALEKATKSDDAEIRLRARLILKDLERGIYPDTPAAVVELINKYETSTSQEKGVLIRKLIAAGSPGCRSLIKLVRQEKDAVTRKEVFVELSSGLSKAVPTLIESGNTAALESVLELALQGDVRLGVAHFAAYHLANGTLPKQIARLEREAKGKVVAKAEYEILAYLYRANGDLDKARKAAKEAERDDLLEAFHYEKADWKALHDNPKLIDGGDKLRYLGLRAAYARLSGDEKTMLASTKEILDLAKSVIEAKGSLMPHLKALLLNGRADDALGLMAKSDAHNRMRYELLVLRLKMTEAAALVEDVRKKNSADLAWIELAHARTLSFLGEKEKASAILEKYHAKIKEGEEADWFADLVESELAINRRDKGFATAAKILAAVNDGSVSARLFDKLFGDKAEEAATLWLVLRRPPAKRDMAATLTKLRALLEGKATKEEVAQLVTASGNVPPNTTEETQANTWRAVGEAAVRCKLQEQAAECFRKAGDVHGLIRLGDLHADKKEWLKASEVYRSAYRLAMKQRPEGKADFDSPRETPRELPALSLFLTGHALVQAKRETEGKRTIERAHLLPLGTAEVRYDLMRDLLRRGHGEASRREQSYLRRLGEPALLEPAAYYTGEGLRSAAIEAATKKQWLAAADGFEQSFLRVLNPELNFGRNAAYVSVPAFIYRMRAQGLAEAGKLDEAKAETQRARQTLPDSIDVTLRLVPIFEKAGRKKDADEMFASARDVYAGLLKQHPKSSYLHNQSAWLSATCKRDLDKGLGHARKAVELSPETAAYHDTLAEVLFQLGKKDEAVKSQKKAVELSPNRAYFKKQLKRIEAGDPKAARPADEDE